jgi:hypothetical protein
MFSFRFSGAPIYHFASVISSTQTLGVFIMAPGIRKNLLSGPLALLAHSSGAQNEANSDTDVSLPGHELWSIQEDGNICALHAPLGRSLAGLIRLFQLSSVPNPRPNVK